MKKCTSCGRSYSDIVTICPNCGRALSSTGKKAEESYTKTVLDAKKDNTKTNILLKQIFQLKMKIQEHLLVGNPYFKKKTLLKRKVEKRKQHIQKVFQKHYVNGGFPFLSRCLYWSSFKIDS